MVKRSHGPLQFKLPHTETGAAQIAEFGAALFLGVPLIILVAFAVRLGLAIVLAQYLTSQAVELAGDSVSYDQAMRKCARQIGSLSNCGLAALAQLKPGAGNTNSGADLFVMIQDRSSLITTTYGPNKRLRAAVDREGKIYKYMLLSHFRFGPLVDGGFHNPIKVTYLTEPIVMNCSAVCTAEHPESVAIGLTPAVDQQL